MNNDTITHDVASVETKIIPIVGVEQGRDLREVVPVYVWELGGVIYPSKREKLIADTWIGSKSLRKCQEVVLRETKKVLSLLVIKKWLGRENVRAYIGERYKDLGYFNGWTKERWVRVMTEHIDGVKRIKGEDLYAMKLMKDVMGWDVGGGVMFNQQINFTQGNGKE